MIGNVLTIAKGGSGIVRAGDKTVFLPGVVAGETVEFAVCGRLRSAWQGRLLRVLEASPQRVEPPCPHYPECGGCNLQHMSYGEQLRCKTEIFLANLKKIAAMDRLELPDILASPPFRYRSKSEFQVRDGRAGFFRKGSHQVVAVERCFLLPEAVEVFFLDRRTRLAGAANAQLQVVSNGREIAARLETPGEAEKWLSPERAVRFEVGPFAYRFAPDNFIQANLFQLQPLQGLLQQCLGERKIARAADLFCGCGFFTLPLAAHCGEVLAVENDPRNVAGLRANLELNRIGNVRPVQADVLRAGLPRAELYVVDPPRGGLSAQVIAGMAGGGAGTVIYYSCDSATFARDLSTFARYGFGLEELRLIDNFPQSDHFEIFSVLERKK
ncbi:MAG TPA: methyltransferase [Acidobacteriota bacterium]